MMNRIRRYILFIFLLSGAIVPGIIVSAEEASTEGIIVRPVMEYKSGDLRDPFKTYLVKEEPKIVEPENVEEPKPQLDLTKLIVQGIIWGVKTPQAIINNQVLTIGDFIENAEILSIDKKGITLSYNGELFDLAAPAKISSAVVAKK
ncbi:MAG TPA: hypothetical protein PKI44_06430 [Candidatus Omnitrophota bacterium]|nr:hypothetical protein [Candidatus Omnitrophota bacterium]